MFKFDLSGNTMRQKRRDRKFRLSTHTIAITAMTRASRKKTFFYERIVY